MKNKTRKRLGRNVRNAANTLEILLAEIDEEECELDYARALTSVTAAIESLEICNDLITDDLRIPIE